MDRRERIRRYGLWPTIWRRLLQLQRPVVGYQRFHCLVMPRSRLNVVERPFTVREFSFEELEPLVGRPDAEITAKGLATARRERHLCVGVFDGHALASYSFNSAGRARFNDQYQFVVPDGWIYHYMAVTLPEWRGKRLHALQLPFLMDRAIPGGKGIVTLVDAVNFASLRSFRRMGFEDHCTFTLLGPRGHQAILSGQSSAGFRFASNASSFVQSGKDHTITEIK